MCGLIDEWTGLGVTEDIHYDGIMWTRRRLPVDYSTEEKATWTLWADTVRYERSFHREYGYLVLYHNTEAESYAPWALEGR